MNGRLRELQATKSILDRVLLKAKALNAKHVKHLHLALGEISELNQYSIQGIWDELSQGTPAQSAQLHFHIITAEVQCMSCFQKYHPENGKIHCPYCGSMGAKILAGEEFQIESLELDYE